MAGYDRQVIEILYHAGKEGMQVKEVARRLYNLNSTLFEPIDYPHLKSSVQSYLISQSKREGGVIMQCGWGRYCISPNYMPQLSLEFSTEEFVDPESNCPDSSEEDPRQLSIFDLL